MNITDSPYLDEGVIPLIAQDENLDDIPDPNNGDNMTGEVLPHDWTSDGN
jgi:hypothetical protein